MAIKEFLPGSFTCNKKKPDDGTIKPRGDAYDVPCRVVHDGWPCWVCLVCCSGQDLGCDVSTWVNVCLLERIYMPLCDLVL